MPPDGGAQLAADVIKRAPASRWHCRPPASEAVKKSKFGILCGAGVPPIGVNFSYPQNDIKKSVFCQLGSDSLLFLIFVSFRRGLSRDVFGFESTFRTGQLLQR
jgi:hypothetical protein